MAQPLVTLARRSLVLGCRQATSKWMLKTAPISHPAILQCCQGYSTTSNHSNSKVLSHSTILLQDGLDIQELPLLVRRTDPREFPFTSYTDTVNNLRPITEQEEAFKARLMDARSLRQVFSILEVPGDKVTAYSAAFALQRLCHLQLNREEIQSFVRKAILHELCETVTRDLGPLTNDMVCSLVQCYLISAHYEDRHVQLINDEVERRIVDSAFSISEICELLDLLGSFTKSDQALCTNLWIHLASRYGELMETNLPRVYQSLRYLPPSQRFLWKLLDKRVVNIWWKLSAEDVSLVMQRMMVGNHFQATVFALVGNWLQLNIHDVTDFQMKNIVAAFNHFNCSDFNLMKCLERYVCAKIDKMDKTLVAMIMEYCRKRKCVSPKIFDAVALDFQKNGSIYKSHEILNSLRPFGHLNYVPPNATQFFMKIEDVLTKTFSDYDPASIVELLTSFVYIERFPVNFLKNIFTPHFLSRVKLIPHLPMKQQTGRYLMELQAATLLEFPKQYIKPIDGDTLGITLTWLKKRNYRMHLSLSKVLGSLIGSGNFYEIEVPKGTPHIIDFQINVDKNKRAMKATRDSLDSEETRLALISIMPEYTCVNTSHPTGELAMKRRHLECLGYTVISVSYDKFTLRCKNFSEQRAYLSSLLSEHIKPRNKANKPANITRTTSEDSWPHQKKI